MTVDVKAKVGVVMCAYNSERTIVESIKSIQRQTFSDWHLVIVDDGSTSPLSDFLATQPVKHECITVIRQGNAGAGQARNRALEFYTQASVEYICTLDSDDIWHPQKLELQQLVLNRDPTIIGVVTRNIFIGDELAYDDCDFEAYDIDAATYDRYDDLTCDLLKSDFFFQPTTLMLRQEYLRKFRYRDARCGEDLHPFLLLGLSDGAVVKMHASMHWERTLAGSLQRNAASNFKGVQAYIDTVSQLLNDQCFPESLIDQAYEARNRYIRNLIWKGKDRLSFKEFIQTFRQYFGMVKGTKNKIALCVKGAYYLTQIVVK